MSKKQEIIGIGWWDTEEEYLKGTTVAHDYEGQNYAEWVADAKKMIRNFEVFNRKKIRKVSLNAEKLLAFCEANGLKVDAQGRSSYVAHVMKTEKEAADKKSRPSFAVMPFEWFNSEDEFQKFLDAWEDPTFIWGDFTTWKSKAEATFREYQSKGEHILAKVWIDASELVNFCRTRNLRLDTAGLDAFIDHKTIEQYESEGYDSNVE